MEHPFQFFPIRRLARIYTYAVAIIAVVTATALRSAFDPILGSQAPYLPFVIGILLVARYEGRGAALLTSALSALSINYFFLEPRYSFFVASRNAGAGLVLFTVVGVIVSVVTSRARASLLSASDSVMSLRKRIELWNESASLSAERAIAEWHAGEPPTKDSMVAALRRKPHFVWLGTAVLLLFLETGFFFAIWGRFADRERSTLHTQVVLERIESLVSLVKDAETGQRGYLLTGDESYLSPYNDAHHLIPVRVDELRKLTANNPSQQARIANLQRLLRQKLAELAQTVALRRTSGAAPALDVVKTNRGLALMDQIRAVTDAFEAEESTLLNRRNEDLLGATKELAATMVAGVGLLLIALLTGSRLIDQHILQREKDEEVRSQLAAIVDSTDDAVIGTTLEGVILTWNHGAEKLYGYTAAEAVGQHVSMLLPPDSQEEMHSIVERLKRGERIEHYETVRIAKDGRRIDAAITISPIRNRSGQLTGASTIAHDITERKRAQDALGESLGRLEKVLQVETVGVMFWDLSTGCMVDANDAFLKMMGYSRSQVAARELKWQNLTPPEYMDVSRAEVEKFLATGRVGPYEKEYFHKDGTRRWLLFAGSSLGGNQCVEFCIDIAARKKVEQALTESELQFRTLANAIPQLCWMAKADGPVTWCNQRYYDYTGRTPEQTEGWGWQSDHDPDALPAVAARWRACVASGEPFDMVCSLRSREGLYHPFLIRTVPVRDREGTVVKWFGTATDITEQRRVEEALRESEERLRLAQQAARVGTFDWNLQAGVNTWTPELERLYGLSFGEFGWTQAAWENLVHPDDRAEAVRQVERAIATGQPGRSEWRVVWPDGSLHWLAGFWQVFKDDSGRPLRLAGATIEITERKQAEEALRQSEQRVRRKLESILSPDVAIGEIELHDILDLEALQSMMDDFYELAHVPIGIIDTRGEVLVKTGWQEICSRFHRVHPDTLRHCIESDVCLTRGIAPGDCRLYRCKNNLCDVATPFVIAGRHVGNLFTGQFLLEEEPVDIELFRSQASRYGFDEKEYLAALATVPRMTRRTAQIVISFLRKFGEIIGKLSYANIKLAKSLTELERAQNALRELSEQRGLALEAADLGSWDYHFQTGQVKWDKRCRSLWGVSNGDEFAYREFFIGRIHPDDRAATSEAVERALAGDHDGAYHREYRIVWPDGSQYWVSSHGKVYFEGEGGERRACRFVGVHKDITERKRAEAALAESEQRYRNLFESMQEAFLLGEVIFDEAGKPCDWRYLEVNPYFEAIYGLKREDVVGRTYREVLAAEHSDRWIEIAGRVALTGKAEPFASKSNTGLYLEGAIYRPQPGQFAALVTDATLRCEAEEQVRQAKSDLEVRVRERTAQLETTNKELEAFAYSVSHDLRAPLRAVEGFSKILLRDYTGKILDETAADYMQRMSAATRRMGQLIAGLLSLSRLTRQEMSRRAVNLSDLASAIMAEYQTREPQRQVQIDIRPGLVAHADPVLARVALENMLGNAWKYTGKTGIARITFGVVDTDHEPAFYVRDNGAGFNMAHADKLFAPFQRLHRSDEFEGNGIGLATVQRVIRRHGGRVWAEAKPGQGAIFYFTLGGA